MSSRSKDCLACEHQQIAHSQAGCWVCACEVPWGGQHAPKPEGSDPYWEFHEGYPRDRTEVEQAQWEQKQKAKDMASTSIKISQSFGQMRTAFEALEAASLKIGDPIALRGVDGKVVKAGLGEAMVGVVEAIDQMSGMVTVRMGG